VNARPSHVEHDSLRLYSFLVDFESALLRFAQVVYEQHCWVWLSYALFLKYMSAFFMRNEIFSEDIQNCLTFCILTVPSELID